MFKTLGGKVLGDLPDFRDQVEGFAGVYSLSFREDELGPHLLITVQNTLSVQLSRRTCTHALKEDTFTPMSVAVLVKIPPRDAVAKAIATAIVLLVTMALGRETGKRWKPSDAGRTCYSVTMLESMRLEGSSQLTDLLSQLTIGV